MSSRWMQSRRSKTSTSDFETDVDNRDGEEEEEEEEEEENEEEDDDDVDDDEEYEDIDDVDVDSNLNRLYITLCSVSCMSVYVFFCGKQYNMCVCVGGELNKNRDKLAKQKHRNTYLIIGN